MGKPKHLEQAQQAAEELLIHVITYARKAERTRKTRPSARTLARSYLAKVKP